MEKLKTAALRGVQVEQRGWTKQEKQKKAINVSERALKATKKAQMCYKIPSSPRKLL